MYYSSMLTALEANQTRRSRRRALITVLTVCAGMHLAVTMVTSRRQGAINMSRAPILLTQFTGEDVQRGHTQVKAENTGHKDASKELLESNHMRWRRPTASPSYSSGASSNALPFLSSWLMALPSRVFPSQNDKMPLVVDSAEREKRRQLKLGKKQQEVRRWVKTRRHKHCVKVKKEIQKLKDLDAFVPIFHHAPCVLPPGTNY